MLTTSPDLADVATTMLCGTVLTPAGHVAVGLADSDAHGALARYDTADETEVVALLALTVAGHRVGTARRDVTVDRHTGRTTVAHRGLRLDDDVQGRGVAGALLAFAFARYRQAGVSHVEVTAVDAGAYSWALAGFTWADRTAAMQLGHALAGRVADGGPPAPLQAAGAPATFVDPDGLAGLAGRLQDGDLTVQPADIARHGRSTTSGWWHDGRMALVGLRWRGRYALQA